MKPSNAKYGVSFNCVLNEYGDILSATLTSHTESDTRQVVELLEGIEEPITEMIGDGGL